jgi:methionyl-tRNA synthetase
VLFICATDEQGTPAELGALEVGLDVRSYCDQQHALQRDVRAVSRMWLYRRYELKADRLASLRCVSVANATFQSGSAAGVAARQAHRVNTARLSGFWTAGGGFARFP